MADDLGAWLRGHRQARGWTNRDMASRIIDAGQAVGDKSMPSLDTMCRNVRRWERGHGSITERYKLHYCRALGIPRRPVRHRAPVPDTGTAAPAVTLVPAVPPGLTPACLPPQAAPFMSRSAEPSPRGTSGPRLPWKTRVRYGRFHGGARGSDGGA